MARWFVNHEQRWRPEQDLDREVAELRKDVAAILRILRGRQTP
jgi:hypothetical protein